MDRPQNANLIPAKPGEVRNPKGRPKGSRNKLGQEFTDALYADFQEHGAAVVEKVRREEPAQYLRVIAGLLPKEVKIDVTDERTDQQIEHSIRLLANQLGLALDLIAGTQPRIEGTATPEGSDETQSLQTVQ